MWRMVRPPIHLLLRIAGSAKGKRWATTFLGDAAESNSGGAIFEGVAAFAPSFFSCLSLDPLSPPLSVRLSSKRPFFVCSFTVFI